MTVIPPRIRFSRIGVVVTLTIVIATIVVLGCHIEATGRKPIHSIAQDELLDASDFTETDQHRRIQVGRWNGSFGTFGYTKKPHHTTDADSTNKTSIVIINSAMETDNSSIAPINFGRLNYVGHSGRWYARYPLGVCEGDCDSDDDCQGDLYCHQRGRNEASPYCTGGEDIEMAVDYCAWNAAFPQPAPLPQPPEGFFRIKLYWEEGYTWQNETFDREWCMISDFDGYPGDGQCWHGTEAIECTASNVYLGVCLEGDPRQWFTFQTLGTTYNGDEDHPEVLIKTMSESCLERKDSAVKMNHRCDPDDMQQRFFALTGSFNGSRFEIGQYEGYTLDNCLTNDHHPKSGELIQFHICEYARAEDSQTSFWVTF